MTTETDLDQFRTPEALLEYCRRQLGEPRRQGREQVFPCPFGTHERPKLSVGERDGRGVFHCWSCDESGDIFQLAAHMAGTNVKTDFPAAVRHVADVLGVCLPEDDRPGASRPGGRPIRAAAPPKPPGPPEPVFLPPKDQRALYDCRVRLRMDIKKQDELARELHLDGREFFNRSFLHVAYGGVLGMTPDNRLLYLYSAIDPKTGQPRYTGAKLRRRICHANPFLKLENGEWTSYGRMNGRDGKDPVRFSWAAGKAFQPWGMEAAMNKNAVFVCEGESDCMAVSQAFDTFRESYQMDTDPETGLPFEDRNGSLEAVIPASVAIPGAKAFPESWKHYFRGKLVILCLDADRAGRDGAQRLKEMLQGVGCTVRDWTPPEPYKDARDMLARAGARILYLSIFQAMRAGEPATASPIRTPYHDD
ncbi:toprim domain-containing protein [Akkermansia sp.]|uniref:toprim domain-containing protein n=1 Tax=Akkermansia sp. TaxID=1872421 RepID=UPI003A843E97